jgi:predicted transcriptional regulator
MSIKIELYRKIRFMYANEGKSMRAIAKELKVARKTVKKYCEGGVQYNINKIPARYDAFREEVETEIVRLLEENKTLPRKQKRNAKEYLAILNGREKHPSFSKHHKKICTHIKRKLNGCVHSSRT